MSNERFSSLKYKIYGLKGLVLDRYPELLKYKAVKEAKELLGDKILDKFIRYIIYLYDPKTELNAEIPDLKERKGEAQTLGGIGKAEAKNFKEMEELQEPYVGLIHCFLLEIYHNRKHREWHTTLQEIDDFTKLRWDKTDTDAKKRAQLSELCDKLHEKADKLEEEIFSDHDAVKESVIIDRWSSPEKYASPTLKLVG